jgi:hypothetical protein
METGVMPIGQKGRMAPRRFCAFGSVRRKQDAIETKHEIGDR